MQPRRYQKPRSQRGTRLVAYGIALVLGIVLTWTMRSAFRVGEDMIHSIDETRPPTHFEREPQRGLRIRSVETPGDSTALDPAHISGRVVIPAGTPADERIDVVLFDRTAESEPVARVRVGADGRFGFARAALPEHARLGIDATYVFLDHPVTFDRADIPADIVLEPELGGRVVGRCVAPAGREDLLRLVVGASVRADGDAVAHSKTCPLAVRARAAAPSDLAELPSIWRSGTIAPDGAFDLHGLAPDADLAIELEDALPVGSKRIAVRAGETVAVEFDLPLVPTLAGVVSDDHGAPVPAAEVALVVVQQGVEEEIYLGETAADGTFDFFVVPDEPAVALRVRSPGFQTYRQALGRLARDQRRDGIDVHLLRPLTIGGRVTWGDGTPARHAAVSVDALELIGTDARDAYTDDDGRFEFGEIDSGLHRVVARARESVDRSDEDELGVYDTRTGVAFATNVTAGTRDLELHLGAGRVLRGRVREEDGTPVDAFGIQARPILGGRPSPMPVYELADSFHDGEGRFALSGLHDGEWEVRATYASFQSTPQRVTVTSAENELEITLSRHPTLAGRVVDARGDPVGEVRVWLEYGGGGGRQVSDYASASDSSGRFQFEHVEPAQYVLNGRTFGRHPTSAVPLEFELAPGQRIDDLALHLVAPGLIHGIVLDAGGAAVSDVSVWVVPRGNTGSPGSSAFRSRTGASGEFEIGALPPGPYVIEAQRGELIARAVDVHVRSGATTEARVALERGVPWRFVATGPEEDAWRNFVAVVDPAGHELLLGWGRSRGRSERELAHGALPTGSYSFRLVAPVGGYVARQVQIQGDTEITLSAGTKD